MAQNIHDIVSPILGSVLAGNIKAKRLELVIEVSNPAWAHQVKLLEEQLLATLNVALPLPIGSIKVNVRREQPNGR